MCVNFALHTAQSDVSCNLESNAIHLRLQKSAVFFRYSGTENKTLQCLQLFSYRILERVMPLIKSSAKEAFRKNVKAEIVQGNKPIKQAVAISYAVKRAAEKPMPKKK